jgi:hypothetical protein
MVEVCGNTHIVMDLILQLCRDRFCMGFVVYKAALVEISLGLSYLPYHSSVFSSVMNNK